MSLSIYPLSWQIFFNIDVLSAITDHLPIKDIICLSHTCKGIRRWASSIYIQQYHHLLKEYVTIPFEFRKLLRDNNSLISGSSVLWLIHGFPVKWHPQDLDIYVPRGGSRPIVDYLIKQGYHKIGPTEIAPASRVYLLWEFHLRSATTLKKGNTDITVDVLEASSSKAIKPIIYFDSTLVMNYLEADKLVSLYSGLTLVNTGVSQRKGSRRNKWLEKYSKRGYDIILDPHRLSRWTPYICPYFYRLSDDTYSLTIVFDRHDMEEVVTEPKDSRQIVWRWRGRKWQHGVCSACRKIQNRLVMLD